jgi:hypothetical protein
LLAKLKNENTGKFLTKHFKLLGVWFEKREKKKKVQSPTATRPNKYMGKISRPEKIATSALEKITTNCHFENKRTFSGKRCPWYQQR